MTRITRIALAWLAALAIVAPVASAMPSRDSVTSTVSPQQDHRSADAREASVVPQTGGTLAAGKDYRSPDARDAGVRPIRPVQGPPTWPVDPEPIARTPVDAAPLADGDDVSPLAYIVPGVIVSVLLVTGMGYAVRTTGRARRARIGA